MTMIYKKGCLFWYLSAGQDSGAQSEQGVNFEGHLFFHTVIFHQQAIMASVFSKRDTTVEL